jgi:hypothetical protein
MTLGISLIVIMTSSICAPGVPGPGLQAQDATPITTSTPSLPLSITSDAALTSFMPKTGSGTAADPYVISNLEIVSNAQLDLFYLASTHKHLIIRGCTFTNTNTGGITGINCQSVGNLTIEGCTFKDFRSNNAVVPIQILNANLLTIKNNRFENCGGISTSVLLNAILIQNVANCVITGNTFTGMYHGDVRIFRINSGNNLTVTGNTIQDCSASTMLIGINCMSVTNSVFRGNSILNMNSIQTRGFSVDSWVNRTRFESNTISGLVGQTSAYGCYISQAANCTFRQNKFVNISSYMLSYGIFISSVSPKNLIFSQNIIASGNIPALLRGTGHILYETAWHVPEARYRYLGNYYWNYTGLDTNGDFIGDTPANVGSGFVDPYPILFGGLDNDGDGLYNEEELDVYHTDPNLADTDGDGWRTSGAPRSAADGWPATTRSWPGPSGSAS